MCNVDKYKKIYHELDQLDLDDTLELVMKSEDKDEQEFFELVSDYFLQKRQKQVIAEGKF